MDNTVSLLYGFLSFSLNYVIVRPAIMYGIADRQGLSKFTLVNVYASINSRLSLDFTL